MNQLTKPIWQKNFSQVYKSSPIIALCGNVNDKYVSCDGDGYSYMLDWLYDFVIKSGYEAIEFFSPAKEFFDIHTDEVKIVESGMGRKKKRPIEILAEKINKEIFAEHIEFKKRVTKSEDSETDLNAIAEANCASVEDEIALETQTDLETEEQFEEEAAVF